MAQHRDDDMLGFMTVLWHVDWTTNKVPAFHHKPTDHFRRRWSGRSSSYAERMVNAPTASYRVCWIFDNAASAVSWISMVFIN